jgi:uncharacterized spore protein YtfJ
MAQDIDDETSSGPAAPPDDPRVTHTFVERLAERLGLTATAKTVFGEPVHADGITVVPVAKVRCGFGGGKGPGSADNSRGGGGGGMQVHPLGYIELKDGQSQFKPIHDPMAWVPLVAVGGLAGMLLLRGINKLTRRPR